MDPKPTGVVMPEAILRRKLTIDVNAASDRRSKLPLGRIENERRGAVKATKSWAIVVRSRAKCDGCRLRLPLERLVLVNGMLLGTTRERERDR